MIDTSLVEYLLKKYVKDIAESKVMRKANYNHWAMYYLGSADLAYVILKDKFDMEIDETDTEYIAHNAYFSVTVEKERKQEDK